MVRSRMLVGIVVVGSLGCGPARVSGLDEAGETTGADTESESHDVGSDSLGETETDTGTDTETETETETETGEPPEPMCGDGVIHWGEDCDDGNQIDGDGCASDCTWELDPLCAEPHPELLLDMREVQFIDESEDMQLCDRLDAVNKSPDWVGPGWYRVGSGLHEFLSHWPPDDYACGGMAGSWHDAGWPLPPDGIVEHEICFAFAGDPCAWSVPSQTVHCGTFRLWLLPDAPDCNLRYCMGAVIPD